MRVVLLLCLQAAPAVALLPRRNLARAGAAVARASSPAAREYSPKVKAIAETRAPFRQARIFFLWPAMVAGASIGSWVSLTRLAAGLGGFRDDVEPLGDGGNLAINLGVIAFAVFFLRGDLKGRDELLQEVAAKEGQAPPPAADESNAGDLL